MCYRSAKAAGGEDLNVKKPIPCWYWSPFDFYPTLAGMLGPTLIGHQVIGECLLLGGAA
jgi:hypothetical protein